MARIKNICVTKTNFQNFRKKKGFIMRHMSKVFLRLIVAFLILALTGGVIWLLFFRPSESVTVFDTLLKLENGEQKTYLEQCDKLKKMDYVKPLNEEGNKTNYAYDYLSDSSVPQQEATRFRYIKLYRAFMFNDTVDGDKNSFKGITSPYKAVANAFNETPPIEADKNITFEQIFNNIEKVCKDYRGYVQYADGFSKATLDNLNDYIDVYKSALNSFSSKVDEILKLQVQTPSKFDATVTGEIYRSYANLYQKYFALLKAYGDLTTRLKDFVNKYAFDSNIVYHSKTVKDEIILKTVGEFINKQVVDPVYFMEPTEATEEQTKQYQEFLSHAYDAVIVNNVNMDETSIQRYLELYSYNEDNASTANAIWGSQNIFTLTREIKAQLIKDAADRVEGEKKPSDLYYTDYYNDSNDDSNNGSRETFEVKIVELIKTIFKQKQN